MIILREHFGMIYHHFQKIIESMGLCPKWDKEGKEGKDWTSFEIHIIQMPCEIYNIKSYNLLERSAEIKSKDLHENFTLFLFEQKCTEYERAWACVEFLKTLYGNDRLSFITTWKSFLTRAINSCQMKGSIPIPADVVRAH